MSKEFMYKGTLCKRQIICFSDKVSAYDIDKDAPILGVGVADRYEESYRQLNSDINPNIIDGLVKFWMSEPSVKFRYLVTSFQKYIARNSKEFQSNKEFRDSVIKLFISLFQQILIEINPEIMNKKPIAKILLISKIQNSSDLGLALNDFDRPYQKSVISQDSMGFVNKTISEDTSKEYARVLEELINLLTIKIEK